ncbi:hypothetical protein BGZ82_005139, partial [Podila clonocystis]
ALAQSQASQNSSNTQSSHDGVSATNITGAHVENLSREVVNSKRRRLEEVTINARMERSLHEAQQELAHVRKQMAAVFKVLGNANLSADVKKQIQDIETDPLEYDQHIVDSDEDDLNSHMDV